MIPITYFMGASDDDLLHFEVAALNRAAVLDKEAKAIKQEAETNRIEAGVVAWLREHRQEMLRTVGSHLESVTELRREDVA